MLHIVWNRFRELGTSQMNSTYLEMFKTWLQARLRTGSLYITFTKADQTQRVMHCTLDPNLLPPLDHAEPVSIAGTKKKRGDLLPVWDIDKGAWRTLTYDRIRTIECETLMKKGDLPWESRETQLK